MSLDKPFDEIDSSDIRELVENEVAENKTIEYKLQLPGDGNTEKKEFLADVSSFANSSGGHLIFGLAEEGGIPTSIPGIVTDNPDNEILRIENIVRDGMKPRISGLSTKSIEIDETLQVIVMRIPRSYAQPHMVTFRGGSRFFARSSAGKYQLDISEIRAAFSLSDNATERIREFRAARISSVVANETPISLVDGAKIVFHSMPFGALESMTNYDISVLPNDIERLNPIVNGITGHRYNLDGYLTYGQFPAADEAVSFLQVYRNGVVEAVDTFLLSEGSIPYRAYERQLLDAVPRFSSIQQLLGVEPPIFLMLSFVGVSGFLMNIPQRATSPRWVLTQNEPQPIDRDILAISEVVLENYESDYEEIMKPVFDSVWNASGWSRCMNYNVEGRWE